MQTTLSPEFAGTPNKVLLGRLGVALAPQSPVAPAPGLDPFSRVKPTPDSAPNGIHRDTEVGGGQGSEGKSRC